jgi:hypothetical protein
LKRVLLNVPPAVLLVCATACALWAQDHSTAPGHSAPTSVRTNLQGVVKDSLRLLMIEHTTRIAAQHKTRLELGGPFWADYQRSVRIPKQWSDGDGWLVNYVGHPGHGAAAGFIWTQHDPSSPSPDSGFNRQYWVSRLRATAWMTAFSLQFEVGPFSEASIGNVGKNPQTTGWVDHVVTPIGGLGVMIAEDALDRYVIARLERRIQNGFVRGVLRTALNPSRALANTASVRPPWHRQSVDRRSRQSPH